MPWHWQVCLSKYYSPRSLTQIAVLATLHHSACAQTLTRLDHSVIRILEAEIAILESQDADIGLGIRLQTTEMWIPVLVMPDLIRYRDDNELL